MAKTNLQVVSTSVATGSKITTTVTYVNPDADSNTLKEFGQMLNELTTNVYGETNRVQTINVDSEEVITLQPGTLTLKENPTITRTSNQVTIPIDQFTINGETYSTIQSGQFFGTYAASVGGVYSVTSASTNSITISIPSTQTAPPSGNGTLRIAVKPIDNYTAAILEKTISIPS